MGGGSGDRAAARCRSVEVLVASVLLGGLALRARVVASRAAGPAAFEEAATTGDDDATLAFVVRTRGYDAVSPDVAALYGTWSHVVEPLREATFEAVNAAPTSSLSWRVATLARREKATTTIGGFSARTWAPFDASHEWDEVRESVLEYAGDAASLTCAAVHDRYRVTLVEVLAASKKGSSKTTEAVENVEPWMNVDAEDGRSATRSSRRRRVVSSDAVVCKYVRRELRQLSGDDREAYFAALEQVHRTSSADGKRLYGAKFRSQKTFLLKHLGEDTVKGCSVFHGADAFLTGHAAFTLELEQALQAVDASVSAPYWDTSLDDEKRGAAWADGLELFGEDWFGARAGAGGPKLDYPALTTGRFAYVDVPAYAAGDRWRRGRAAGAERVRPPDPVLWDVAHNTGHLKCPSSCDEAAGFAACRCACPALDAEFAAGNATLAYAFLDSIGLLSRYAGSQRGDVFVRTVDESRAAAAAALDVAAEDGDAFDESWDWHNASGSALTVGSYCLGKAWRDPTPFSNFLGETDDARYTNADLYALFDPTNARLPYVFDDMSWTHCRAASSR
ncbi:hypothetical protein JL721_8279 [Aureococcus anophagefferens]|nr:hypothetical protein JL721_8279 [Aureococcus anophagefferens]